MKLSKIDWVLVIILILVAGARFVNIENTVGPYWSGAQQSYIALQMSNGEVPYKDFYHVYPPLGHYLMALFMTIFGKSLVVGSIFSNLMAILSAFILFLIGKMKSVRVGLIASLLFLISPEFVRNGYYVDYIGVPFLLLSFYLITKEGNNLKYLFAGIAIAAAVFTKQSFGYFVIATLAFMLFYRNRKVIAHYIIGGALFTLLMTMFLYLQTGSFSFINQLMTFVNYPSSFSATEKYMAILVIINPFYLLGIALAVYTIVKIVKKEDVADNHKLVSFATLAFALFLISIKMFGTHYVVIFVPFLCLIAAAEIIKIRISFKEISKNKIYHVFLVFVILNLFALGFLTQFSKQILHYPEEHAEIKEVADYIKSITNANDTVLVDNSAINFYADRNKPGKWYDTSAYAFNNGYLKRTDLIQTIKKEKPKVISILDSRLDWLEKEDVLKMYKFDKQLNGEKIYVLKVQ